MNPATFCQLPEVRRALERAARCAAVPLRLHYVTDGHEGPRMLGFGACNLCAYVAQLDDGAKACRSSREEGAALAQAHRGARAFVCHLGLSCVAAPALPDVDIGFVITLGPYWSAEGPQHLEDRVLRGLRAFGVREGAPPAPRTGIHVVPGPAVPEVAQWLMEVLAGLWEKVREGEAPAELPAEGPESVSAAHRGKLPPTLVPYPARDIAAALAGGNVKLARKLVYAALVQGRAGRRSQAAARRARTVAVVAATLEAAAQAGRLGATCWERFPELIEQVEAAGTSRELTAAAMSFLNRLYSTAKGEAPLDPVLVKMNRLVYDRLPGKIELREIATALGVHPTSITHRLKDRFKMGFRKHVMSIRINKAQDLLRDTQLSARERWDGAWA